MTDLITAFQIFSKYTDKKYCLSADHDVIYIYVDPTQVSPEDIIELEKLSFHTDFGLRNFYYFV